MFWENWIPAKYHVKTDVCCVELFYGNESTQCHSILLKNKGGKVELVEKGSSDIFNVPSSVLKNKIPLVFVLNGKGVVLKKISIPEGTANNYSDLIRENLPAINTADFYIQLYKQSDHSAFIAFCRKEQLNEALRPLQQENFNIASVHLGAAAVIALQPVWGNLNAFATSGHTVELSNNVVDSIVPSEINDNNTAVTFDGIAVSAPYVIGFGCGLAYFMRRALNESENAELNDLPLKHLQKNKLNVLMIAIVAIAFVLAVSNVLVYTNFFDKNNKLETELQVYQGKNEKINNLLNEYTKNKDLIEGAGVLTKNKLSEYADKIAITLPDEVSLAEFYFNPLTENEDEIDSVVKFDNKHIVLRGNCNKSLIVNEWLNVLKMQKFVKDVSLEKFVYNSEGLVPNFEIKLVTE